MLVLDSFRGHTMEEVKTLLKTGKTDLVVIPGGLTSMLQPLDVCINRPFKFALKQKYKEWMAGGNHQYTPTGKNKEAKSRSAVPLDRGHMGSDFAGIGGEELQEVQHLQ